MRRSLLAISVMTIAVAILWSGLISWEAANAQARRPPKANAWEYKSVIRGTPDINIAEFNRLGAEGWELAISVSPRENTTYYLFKRPR